MANDPIFCDICGTRCNASDIYCKSCFTKLHQEQPEAPQVIQGIDNNDLSVFIDKNSDYYMDKLANKEDKKHFFQFNWAAMLFGNNWFLYRGMYKVVVIHFVIVSILSLLLSFGIRILYNADYAYYRSSTEAISEYLENGGEKYAYTGNYYKYSPEYRQLIDNQTYTRKNFNKLYIGCVLIILIFQVFYRLSANCIYRYHIIQNIGKKEGGASLATMIGGIFLVNILENSLYYFILLISGLNTIIQG